MNMSTDVEQTEGSIFSSVQNHGGGIGRHKRSREEADMDNQPNDSEQLTCAEPKYRQATDMSYRVQIPIRDF